MKCDIAGQTIIEDGKAVNEDAFLILRPPHVPVPVAMVLDGAGRSNGVAKRAASMIAEKVRTTSLGALLRDDTWTTMLRQVDMSLNGGPQTTACLAVCLGDEAIIVATGDTRAYVVGEAGTRLITEDCPRERLGSGDVSARAWRVRLQPRTDVLLILSDGAWSVLGHGGIQRAAQAALAKDAGEIAGAILDAAGRRVRGDDQTCVAVKVTREI